MKERLKIVAVDDDEGFRSFMISMLQRFVGNVSSFQSAFSAWEFMKRNPVDILVSDVEMDGMGGLELLSRVKQSLPQVRCIIVSGNPCNEGPALKLGAEAFLLKPFGPIDLVEAMGIGILNHP
jgi:two-component system response regulator FlrC